jgi:hypothetical protein
MVTLASVKSNVNLVRMNYSEKINKLLDGFVFAINCSKIISLRSIIFFSGAALHRVSLAQSQKSFQDNVTC